MDTETAVRLVAREQGIYHVFEVVSETKMYYVVREVEASGGTPDPRTYWVQRPTMRMEGWQRGRLTPVQPLAEAGLSEAAMWAANQAARGQMALPLG